MSSSSAPSSFGNGVHQRPSVLTIRRTIHLSPALLSLLLLLLLTTTLLLVLCFLQVVQTHLAVLVTSFVLLTSILDSYLCTTYWQFFFSWSLCLLFCTAGAILWFDLCFRIALFLQNIQSLISTILSALHCDSHLCTLREWLCSTILAPKMFWF